MDAGEDPAAAAARECEEEIGLVPGRVDFAGAWYPTPGFCTEVMNYYRLGDLRERGSEGPPAHKDEDEDIRVHVLPFAQALDCLAAGRIQNSPAIIALQWLALNRPRLRANASITD